MEYSLDTSLDHELWSSLDLFTQGYIESMMWTLTDEDGHSLDYLGLHDIAPEAIEKCRAVCAEFQEMNREDLDQASDESHRDDSSHGHDFWLTRNHHGAGFWDRGYDETLGEALTTAAHAYGEAYACVGDDGLVYVD